MSDRNGEQSQGDANPFQNLKSRSLLLWWLVGLPVVIVAFAIAFAAAVISRGISIDDLSSQDPERLLDPAVVVVVASIWFYGTFVLWAVRKFDRLGIRFGRLIGEVPADVRWSRTLGLVFALVLFSVGSFWVLHYLLSLGFPAYVAQVLEHRYLRSASQTSTPEVYNLLTLVVVLSVGPASEELLFRGVLLHRWSVKWGVRRGVLASSLAFAAPHLDNLAGAFVFGLVMSLLYLRVRTLILPIAAHMVNNGVALSLEIADMGLGGQIGVSTLEQFHANLWIGVLLLVLSTPWVVRFLRRNWPGPGCPLPYGA